MTQQRRVLITGASKGIGRAVADRLAARGAEPIGIARTAPESFPGPFYPVDLANRAATATALEAIVADGTVDAVVNNVGFAQFGRIGSIDLDHLFDTYDLTVRTAVQVVQAVLPGMRATGWGRIVNLTSLTTLGTPERTRSPVGSSREALLLESIPLHRVAKPVEIAHAVCFLLDEDAGYITGQTIRVDGGGSIAA